MFCSLQIQYFSRAFQPLKNSFVETLRAVVLSVRWFLVLLLLTLWGFAGELTLMLCANGNPQRRVEPQCVLEEACSGAGGSGFP